MNMIRGKLMMDEEKERILILHLKADAEKMIRRIMGNDSKTTELRTYTGKEHIQTVRGVAYRFLPPEE